MRYRIPLIDLRETFPLGEPVRKNPAPKQSQPANKYKSRVGFWSVATFVVTAAFVAFLLTIAIITIELFGPLAGGLIVLVAIGKLSVRS